MSVNGDQVRRSQRSNKGVPPLRLEYHRKSQTGTMGQTMVEEPDRQIMNASHSDDPLDATILPSTNIAGGLSRAASECRSQASRASSKNCRRRHELEIELNRLQKIQEREEELEHRRLDCERQLIDVQAQLELAALDENCSAIGDPRDKSRLSIYSQEPSRVQKWVDESHPVDRAEQVCRGKGAADNGQPLYKGRARSDRLQLRPAESVRIPAHTDDPTPTPPGLGQYMARQALGRDLPTFDGNVAD